MIQGIGSEPKARQARPRAAAYAAKPRGADAPRPALEGANKKLEPWKDLSGERRRGRGRGRYAALAQHQAERVPRELVRPAKPPTRAAWKEYRRLEALDREEGYLCYDDPEHELYQDPEAQWDEVDEAMPLPSPKKSAVETPEEPVEDSGPRCWSIKDDGWD